MKLPIIGEGLCSIVYQHKDPSKVIKVFDDSDYLEWVKFSMAHKNNPFVPKVYSLKKVETQHVVVLEKLLPVTQVELRNFFITLANQYDLRLNPANRFISWFTEAELRLIGKDKNHLAEVCAWFADRVPLLDLHTDNVMKRGPQIVFADPVIGG